MFGDKFARVTKALLHLRVKDICVEHAEQYRMKKDKNKFNGIDNGSIVPMYNNMRE